MEPTPGYIEAIEARLHKMEGLLGGLVKDKDPRAEIVRAELDAMAREAEMTGLKLRRSKAYEEINQAMAAAASEASANGPSKNPTHLPSTNYSETQYHHQHQRHPHEHQQHQQHHHYQHPQHPQHPQHHHKAPSNVYNSEGQYVSGGYHPHRHPMETHPTIKQEHDDYSTSFFRSSQVSQKQPGYNTNELDKYQPSHPPSSTHQHYQSPAFGVHDVRSDNHSSNYDAQSGNYEKGYSHPYHTHQPSLWTSPQPPADLTRYTHSSLSDMKDTTEMPSKEVMDHLLTVYFQHIHPVLPMLHHQTLSDQIRSQELPPSHLLFAILGLASRFSENNTFRVPQPGYDRPPCTLFYEKAKHLFKEEYDNSQIGTVQALLLMAVQQMGFCESQRAWLYVGMAIRMAQDLGLNKDLPEHEQVRNRLTSELRKRTWWSCYVVERLVCAGLGRPLTITQKECETTYPQYDDDNMDLGIGALAGKTLIASNFVHLITLSKIQGNILEFIKARAVRGHVHNDSTGSNTSTDDREPTIDISQAAFFSLDKALTSWRQDLPEPLQTPTADSPHFSLFLHMTYNTLIILLHRPEVSYSATSASLCTQAAATITEITEILMNAKALTSTFISCLYAIFSAGVVHFMNIPGMRSCDSNVSSPRMNLHSRSTDNHATSAKANMKRCIDALKFLATHWVSAARRAKVLEDLLDLKHVSLKDLEVDSFKTTVMEPTWAKASTGYGKILESPREGHDKLRQQCRSKMMAIHSLLADDNDDYNARHWDDVQENGKDGYDMDMDNTVVPAVTFEDTAMEVEATPVITSVDSSPSTISVQSSISVAPSTTIQLDTDPMMLMSTHLANDGAHVGFVRAISTPAGSSHNLDPMISESHTLSRSTTPQQGAMFDPFSMPSSITFPSLNQGRRMSCGGNLGTSCHDGSSPIWSTDAHTNRSTAWSGTPSSSSSPRSRTRTVSGCQVVHRQTTPQKMGLTQQMDNMGFDEEHDHDEEHDLVWNDMPPTLGLDEWMAYIGAMMMRWLASGQSSPRSVLSS
ncbi:hypothetical protein CPB97_001222 [Podila verticillata]|nr:hypothetical protein CPB97_001222 [Podila verticillata]